MGSTSERPIDTSFACHVSLCTRCEHAELQNAEEHSPSIGRSSCGLKEQSAVSEHMHVVQAAWMEISNVVGEEIQSETRLEESS